MVKEAITRLMDSTPGTGWWEWLGEVVFMLRMSISKAHGYSPYMVVFKLEPLLSAVHLGVEGLDLTDATPDT